MVDGGILSPGAIKISTLNSLRSSILYISECSQHTRVHKSTQAHYCISLFTNLAKIIKDCIFINSIAYLEV